MKCQIFIPESVGIEHFDVMTMKPMYPKPTWASYVSGFLWKYVNGKQTKYEVRFYANNDFDIHQGPERFFNMESAKAAAESLFIKLDKERLKFFGQV